MGDATNPIGDGKKLILHVCNNVGAWGAGFVMALSKKWKEPEADYRAMKEYILGDLRMVHVEEGTYVVNIIGQESTKGRNKGATLPPIRYVAIEHAMKYLASIGEITPNTFSIHMPRLGSGLAGGNWKVIETIIEETLCKADIPVTVYDLP